MQGNRPGAFWHSIRFQLTAAIFCILAGVILLTLWINNRYLGRYYLSEKKEALFEVQAILHTAAETGEEEEEALQETLVAGTQAEGIELLVLSAEGLTQRALTSDVGLMRQCLFANILGGRRAIPVDVEVLESKDGRTLQQVQELSSRRTYLELFGILPDNSIYLLRSPVESLENSSRIANRFYMYVGLFTALLGTFFAFIVASGMTGPLRELTALSDRMKKMDFSAHFSGAQKNEIGVLGENFNELSEALEQGVADLKTANTLLQQDLKKKEEVEAMRQEFISNVTHELKTPIALISGYAEGLRDNVTDEESRTDYCDVIVDEAHRMNGMVQKLLTLNHLEFGKTELNLERVDLTALLRAVVERDEILVQAVSATIRGPGSEPVYVWSDAFLLEEVFENYFTNALHYAEDEKLIDIKVEKENGKVRVSVFNSGKPIPEEVLPHIWEKFYKADKARSRDYGGSGVGLSIVKAIQELLGEDYGVANYENGVAFWFTAEEA